MLQSVIAICKSSKYKISHVTIQMEDVNDMESLSSDKNYESNKIEFEKKFSTKLLNDMFSS